MSFHLFLSSYSSQYLFLRTVFQKALICQSRLRFHFALDKRNYLLPTFKFNCHLYFIASQDKIVFHQSSIVAFTSGFLRLKRYSTIFNLFYSCTILSLRFFMLNVEGDNGQIGAGYFLISNFR
jgi:hypothetical protein